MVLGASRQRASGLRRKVPGPSKAHQPGRDPKRPASPRPGARLRAPRARPRWSGRTPTATRNSSSFLPLESSANMRPCRRVVRRARVLPPAPAQASTTRPPAAAPPLRHQLTPLVHHLERHHEMPTSQRHSRASRTASRGRQLRRRATTPPQPDERPTPRARLDTVAAHRVGAGVHGCGQGKRSRLAQIRHQAVHHPSRIRQPQGRAIDTRAMAQARIVRGDRREIDIATQNPPYVALAASRASRCAAHRR